MGLFDLFKKPQPAIIKEIPIPGLDEDASPVLRVFDNGTTYLMTEWFPWEDCRITEDMIVNDMATYIQAKVTREDRDRFLIMCNDPHSLEKIISYLQAHK